MTAGSWRSHGSPLFWDLLDAYFFEPLRKAMSKWHYDKAGDFMPRRDKDRILDDLKSPDALRPVADAFVTNVYRIHAFWQLKPEVMERACVIMANIYSILFELTGHVDFE